MLSTNEVAVSIVIPVYNVEAYVEECLESVARQTVNFAIECIVVDDRGEDRSMEIVRKFIAKYEGAIDFKIIVMENNGGLSAARNTGIKASSGKYVYFLDSDDLITPDCINTLYRHAVKHPNVEIVVGNFQTVPQTDVFRKTSLTDKNFPEFSDDVKWIRSIFLSTFPIIAWNKLINRSFIIKHELYFKEGLLHEDAHWQASAYHHVNSVAFEYNITYLYRIRQGSITCNPVTEILRMQNLFYICKEMYGKKVLYDYPWYEWIKWSLETIRFYPGESEIASNRMSYTRQLTKILIKNSSIPKRVRLLFAYNLLPRPYYRHKIFVIIYRGLMRKIR